MNSVRNKKNKQKKKFDKLSEEVWKRHIIFFFLLGIKKIILLQN